MVENVGTMDVVDPAGFVNNFQILSVTKNKYVSANLSVVLIHADRMDVAGLVELVQAMLFATKASVFACMHLVLGFVALMVKCATVQDNAVKDSVKERNAGLTCVMGLAVSATNIKILTAT